MAELSTTHYVENEVAKADDFNYTGRSAFENLKLILYQLLGQLTNNVIIRGFTVEQRTPPSLNINITDGLAYDPSLRQLVHSGGSIGPIPVTSPDLFNDRRDIVEIRYKEITTDTQVRAFKDPVSGTISYQATPTRTQFILEAKVKEGVASPNPVAPPVDSGWVKIAEINVRANTSQILTSDIFNCGASVDGEANPSWTSDVSSTFRLEGLSPNKTLFRQGHTATGQHLASLIAVIDTYNQITGTTVEDALNELTCWRRLRTELPGLLIPLYIYPTDAYNNSTYNGLANLKRTYPNVPFLIVLNPSNGPGAVEDGNYTLAINMLRAVGMFVLGYVYTSYAARTIEIVKADIAKWKTLYPAIDGIFFDQQASNIADQPYYRELVEYAATMGLHVTVGNAGVEVDNSWYKIFDIVIEWESSTYPSTPQGSWPGGKQFYKRALLKYANSDIVTETPSIRGMLKYYGWTYFTQATMPNPWSTIDLSYIQAVCELMQNATSMALADSLIRRDTMGRAKIASPSAADDITTKQYVDTVVAAVGAGIIEVGSNSNGTWIKFSDGTMIQMKKWDKTKRTWQSSGSYYFTFWQWNFPCTFVSSDIVTSHNAVVFQDGIKSTTITVDPHVGGGNIYAYCEVWASLNTNPDISSSTMAIGRWK